MKTGLPGEQNLYNKGHRLEITHLPTDYSVAFSAFIEQMSDSYNCDWAAESVFGRMDPVSTFERTRRNLSLIWRVPASDTVMARDNLDKIKRLITFLYPTYSNAVGATMMNQSPLWSVKFGNLVCNAANGQGLLGWVRGITMDPALEEGVFMLESGPGVPVGSGINYYPKTVRLNMELAVVHEHSLGWENVGSTEEGKEIFVFRKDSSNKESPKTGMSFPYSSRRHNHEVIHEISPDALRQIAELRNSINTALSSEDPFGNIVQLATEAISPADKPEQDRVEEQKILK